MNNLIITLYYDNLPKSNKESQEEPNLGSNSTTHSLRVERISLQLSIGHGVDHEQRQGTEHSAQVIQVIGILVVRYRSI